ncbi:MAG: twin-arginine translocase TatA/TatE family subunit [Caldilineae bacterium]|nr:twin-arginine translocase TatA/TatE family subunit [Chloroflexota bacterium]MCB9176648.1 twin-arginine translocase TatA/TatE family subunit [Caldilineae bacterium]
MPAPFNINGWEFVVLAVLFLVLFGPERLPEIAVQAGRLIREIRQAAEAATTELTRELKAAAEEHGDAAADVREFGESARRILQSGSKTVNEGLKHQLRGLSEEIGSIGTAIDAPLAPEAPPAEAASDAGPESAAAERTGDATDDPSAQAVESPVEEGEA